MKEQNNKAINPYTASIDAIVFVMVVVLIGVAYSMVS